MYEFQKRLIIRVNGCCGKASFKSADPIQAPGSIIHKTFLIDSILKDGALKVFD